MNARLQAVVRPAFAQVQGRWRGLSPRERLQIVGMIAIVAAALVWLVLVKPAIETLGHWDSELPKLRSQAAALKDVLADAGPVAAPGDSSLGPVERVRDNLDAAGLAGTYELQEAGDTLHIAFGRNDSPRAIAWLLDAPALGLKVQQVTLQRSEEAASPDRASLFSVQATVVMQNQSGKKS